MENNLHIISDRIHENANYSFSNVKRDMNNKYSGTKFNLYNCDNHIFGLLFMYSRSSIPEVSRKVSSHGTDTPVHAAWVRAHDCIQSVMDDLDV